MRVGPTHAFEEGSPVCAVYLVRRNRLAHRNRPSVDMQHLCETLVAERFAVQLVTTTETSDSVVAFHPLVTPHKVVVHSPSIVLESLVDKHIIDVIDLFHIRFWLPLHQQVLSRRFRLAGRHTSNGHFSTKSSGVSFMP